jgi:hypothetical protein
MGRSGARLLMESEFSMALPDDLLEAWERFIERGYDVIDVLEELHGYGEVELPDWPPELPAFDELLFELGDVTESLREHLMDCMVEGESDV